ncbi:glycoside hydrolase family 32 protein [Reinekea marinisedimentorum]|uniref:Fructan beta-fructosidase n=1 Tax=Reinekea marinisedimentorum TaxID=230495 RepID=A0A4R3I3G0_9GAMM|nr:glycoside hydrolase family 32 protein [Reinekea marinisedimentorum]TCS40355.1 fructan beta-fructosidase [Reinekea marinisedimentorum]
MSSNDRFRPQVHFTPPSNWMNDPNGCLYHNGVYHLFYQYHPGSTQWGPMHWGHATSADLLHWQHHAVALQPDAALGAAFSGSAIHDRDNLSGLFTDDQGLLAFYTTHLDRGPEQDPLQQQCMAYSRDGGNSWQPIADNPVVANPGIKDFRDPKVFYHQPSQHWIMVVVAGQQVNFYRSRNLLQWEYCGEFGKYQGHDEVVWECPDLVEMTDDSGRSHWVLFISGVTPAEKPFPPMQYFIGHFDGLTFAETAPGEMVNIVDFGADFYAAQSFHGTFDNDGRHIWIAWANYWPYANVTPADHWRGMMSLPRELSLVTVNGLPRLQQRVVREFDARLSEPYRVQSPQAWAIQNPELAQSIEFKVTGAKHTDATLRLNNAKGDELCLSWSAQAQTLTLDRTGIASSDFHPIFNQIKTVSLLHELGDDSVLDLRIIVDRCSVEVFALNGRVVLTSQLFPEQPFALASLECVGPVEVTQAYLPDQTEDCARSDEPVSLAAD